MSFPKTGKFFPQASGEEPAKNEQMDDLTFATVIALALERSVGNAHSAVKITAGWTGANERTVKNWFAARYGPSGANLVGLMGHCDEVLEAVLMMAGRSELLARYELAAAETHLDRALSLIRLSMDRGDVR